MLNTVNKKLKNNNLGKGKDTQIKPSIVSISELL
jgi:hypothetical protein